MEKLSNILSSGFNTIRNNISSPPKLSISDIKIHKIGVAILFASLLSVADCQPSSVCASIAAACFFACPAACISAGPFYAICLAACESACAAGARANGG